jgi:hypothetical protein
LTDARSSSVERHAAADLDLMTITDDPEEAAEMATAAAAALDEPREDPASLR